MPDNVKTALSLSLQRLLRPLVRIMLREGLTYSNFATIAEMAFVESAAKDFSAKGNKASLASVSALTGISPEEISSVVNEYERFEASDLLEIVNPFALVLHGWHNDRDYVGPYGFPVDLPFIGSPLSFSILAARHAPGVPPEAILQELKRAGAVTEVGSNIWKPLKQEYIDPNLSPENVGRMANLVESLIATLENNTRKTRDGTDLFERTMYVDVPLASYQLLELQSYLKVVAGRFLQRVDAFAAVELHEKMGLRPGDRADIHAGLECFLYVEPAPDDVRLRDAIDFGNRPN